jgi:hypothetical protein
VCLLTQVMMMVADWFLGYVRALRNFVCLGDMSFPTAARPTTHSRILVWLSFLIIRSNIRWPATLCSRTTQHGVSLQNSSENMFVHESRYKAISIVLKAIPGSKN